MIPEKGNYLQPLLDGGSSPDSLRLFDASTADQRLRVELLRCLNTPLFDRIDLVVSFIMSSGLDIVLPNLRDAIDRGAKVRILTTDYMDITDPDALSDLLDLCDEQAGVTSSSRSRSGGRPARVSIQRRISSTAHRRRVRRGSSARRTSRGRGSTAGSSGTSARRPSISSCVHSSCSGATRALSVSPTNSCVTTAVAGSSSTSPATGNLWVSRRSSLESRSHRRQSR